MGERKERMSSALSLPPPLGEGMLLGEGDVVLRCAAVEGVLRSAVQRVDGRCTRDGGEDGETDGLAGVEHRPGRPRLLPSIGQPGREVGVAHDGGEDGRGEGRGGGEGEQTRCDSGERGGGEVHHGWDGRGCCKSLRRFYVMMAPSIADSWGGDVAGRKMMLVMGQTTRRDASHVHMHLPSFSRLRDLRHAASSTR